MFWKPQRIPKTFKEGIDFRFHPYNEDVNAIELLIEPYENVLYHYGMVGYRNDMGTPILRFDYSIINTGCYNLIELEDDKIFKNLIGDILSHILITEQVCSDKNRTYDTEEFDI